MGDGDSCSSEECECPFQENVQTGWELLLLSRGKPVFPGWKEAERLQSGCQRPGEQAGVFRAGGRPERGCRLWWQHLCPSLSHGEDTAVTAWVLGFTFHRRFLSESQKSFVSRKRFACSSHLHISSCHRSWGWRSRAPLPPQLPCRRWGRRCQLRQTAFCHQIPSPLSVPHSVVDSAPPHPLSAAWTGPADGRFVP